jgi:hypothetical protein
MYIFKNTYLAYKDTVAPGRALLPRYCEDDIHIYIHINFYESSYKYFFNCTYLHTHIYVHTRICTFHHSLHAYIYIHISTYTHMYLSSILSKSSKECALEIRKASAAKIGTISCKVVVIKMFRKIELQQVGYEIYSVYTAGNTCMYI